MKIIKTRHIGTLYIDEFAEPSKDTPFEEERIYIYDYNKKPIDYVSFETIANEADELGCTSEEVYNNLVREIKAARTVREFFKKFFPFSADLITEHIEDLSSLASTKEEILENEFVVIVGNSYILLKE